MAEGNVQAGIEVLFKLVADLQSAQAQGVRAGAAIMAEIEKKGFKITPDMGAIRNVGQQVAKEIGEAIEGKAAEKLAQLGRELGARRATPGMGIYRPEEDADRIKFRSSVRQHYEAQDATAKASKEAATGLKSFADILREFKEGAPPRRVLSQAFAGGLMGMGMGEGGASLIGGLGGLLAGSMIFRVGWNLMESIEKIPETIARNLEQVRDVNVMRAAAIQGSALPTDLSPIEKITGGAAEHYDRQTLLRFGAGRFAFNRLDPTGKASEDFQNVYRSMIVANALRPAGGRLSPDQLAQYSYMAGISSLFANSGDPLKIATALMELETTGSPAAAGTLLGIPGMKQRMVGPERARKHLGSQFTDEQVWQEIQKSIATELASPIPGMRVKAENEVFNAFSSMIQESGVQRQMQQRAGEVRPLQKMKEQWNAGMPWWLGGGDEAHPSLMDTAMIKTYMTEREAGYSREQAIKSMENLARAGQQTEETIQARTKRMREYVPLAEALMGNAIEFLGGKAMPFAGTQFMPQPSFSFSSLSGFANKMQMEGGFHMDAAETTADNTNEMKNTLKDIHQAIVSQQTVHEYSGAPMNSPMHAIFQALGSA